MQADNNSIAKFHRFLVPYQERARKRRPEYLNAGMEDVPFSLRVLYELLFDIIEKQRQFDEILQPAPEFEQTEE